MFSHLEVIVQTHTDKQTHAAENIHLAHYTTPVGNKIWRKLKITTIPSDPCSDRLLQSV